MTDRGHEGLVRRATAPAKINLALVVGPLRPDGKHEVVTVLQPIRLADGLTIEPADTLHVDGFADDTLVATALETLAARARVQPNWDVHIEKRIPVTAGLGGGSSDAAAPLRLANETLDAPLPQVDLEQLAATLGADVPFFLRSGPQLGVGDGSTLEPLDLPQGFHVVLLVPHGEEKESTAAIYRRFDEGSGERGFVKRRRSLLEALRAVRSIDDLAALPPNDLAASPRTAELLALGAFRADVSGAGPTVYGLFADHDVAEAAANALKHRGGVFVTEPLDKVIGDSRA